MKPNGLVARRADYTIYDCPHSVAVRFIAQHHYARGASNTSTHAHALIRKIDGLLVGVALWIPPTKAAAESVSKEAWRGVLSLSRLAVAETEPQNATTLLLGASMRRIKRDKRWHTFLTYADTRQGHTGAIYKATNWEYLGLRRGDPSFVDKIGRQIARKAGNTTRTAEQMLALGYTKLPPSEKHKFIYRAQKGR
jgi:hypothetical protein